MIFKPGKKMGHTAPEIEKEKAGVVGEAEVLNDFSISVVGKVDPQAQGTSDMSMRSDITQQLGTFADDGNK